MTKTEIARKATVSDVDGATVKKAVENHTGMVKALKGQITAQAKQIADLNELLELTRTMLKETQKERNKYIEAALRKDTIPRRIAKLILIFAGMVGASIISRLIF